MKTKRRNKLVRVHLTQEVLLSVEKEAFKNCRTVSQQISFIVERNLPSSKQVMVLPAIISHGPGQVLGNAQFAAFPEPPPEPIVPVEETEGEIAEIVAKLGMTEAQIKAVRLICKTSAAVLVQLKADLQDKEQEAAQKELVAA